MDEFKPKIIIKNTSEKNFGIFFSLIFLALNFYNYIFYGFINFLYLTIFFYFIFSTFFYPKLLRLPYFLWFKLGEFLGLIISPIVMLAIYLLVFFPISLFLKLLQKDLIQVNFDKKKKTYWIIRQPSESNMKNQF